MNALPIELIASLSGVKGFDKNAFEQVHASGEQVTSIRLNPGKSEESGVKSEALVLPFNQSPKEPFRATGQLVNKSTIYNPRLNDSVGQVQSTIDWCPHGYYLPTRPSFTFDPLFHAGVYYVQEASSMFLWEVLKQTVGEGTTGKKVLDLCAAPGGKSTLLASYFHDGLVVANEVIRARAAVLVENITKWGSVHAVVCNNDPKDFSALPGYFDVMVVDAPCSGSGLFRRDAEAINEWSEENVTLCSQRQQRILADAIPALKPGGVLVYSTCSYSKEEDEDILDWISDTFNVENIALTLDDSWGIEETESALHKAKGYRFYPYRLKGEGFFIAAFRKTDGETEEYRVQGLPKISKDEAAAVEGFMKSDNMFFYKQADKIAVAPEAFKTDIAILQKHLYLRKAGIIAGALKGKDFIPGHELAMSMLVPAGIQRVPFTKQQAIEYLQKKDISPGNFAKGWALATYEGIDLGWMKILPNRANNYYPVEWRILKDVKNF